MGAFSDTVKNKMLDALVGRATYTAEAAFYAKLHIGSPGTAGTGNPAGETTRQACTFGSAPGAGAISNTAQAQWTNLSTTETLTHVSFWSASSGGTFLGADDLPASKAVTAGDTFTIPIGDLDLSISGTLP
jgi:hypothetical protein